MNLHSTLSKEMDTLISTEDFLNFFTIPYDEDVVKVKRLHILQRFHDYVRHNDNDMPDTAEEQYIWLQQWLTQAYDDFVVSDAITEKVFRVFRMTPRAEGGSNTFVPLEEIFQ